jgi:hypothetical protein
VGRPTTPRKLPHAGSSAQRVFLHLCTFDSLQPGHPSSTPPGQPQPIGHGTCDGVTVRRWTRTLTLPRLRCFRWTGRLDSLHRHRRRRTARCDPARTRRQLTGVLATARALPEFRTILVDLRGHGRSTRIPNDLSREAFAADVVQVIETMVGGPVVLVGQSMGGHTGDATRSGTAPSCIEAGVARNRPRRRHPY